PRHAHPDHTEAGQVHAQERHGAQPVDAILAGGVAHVVSAGFGERGGVEPAAQGGDTTAWWRCIAVARRIRMVHGRSHGRRCDAYAGSTPTDAPVRETYPTALDRRISAQASGRACLPRRTCPLRVRA